MRRHNGVNQRLGRKSELGKDLEGSLTQQKVVFRNADIFEQLVPTVNKDFSELAPFAKFYIN